MTDIEIDPICTTYWGKLRKLCGPRIDFRGIRPAQAQPDDPDAKEGLSLGHVCNPLIISQHSLAHLLGSFALENVPRDDQAKMEPSGKCAANHTSYAALFQGVTTHISKGPH